MACIARLSLRVTDRPAFPPNEGRAAELEPLHRHARTGQPQTQEEMSIASPELPSPELPYERRFDNITPNRGDIKQPWPRRSAGQGTPAQDTSIPNRAVPPVAGRPGIGRSSTPLRVDDVPQAMADLPKLGLKPRNPTPHSAPLGKKAAFIDPAGTRGVLWEMTAEKRG